MSYPLEPDENAVRAMLSQLTDRVVQARQAALELAPDARAGNDVEALRALIEPLPESGSNLDGLLDILFEQSRGTGLVPTSPGFMAYVPGGGIFEAALADLAASTLNPYVGLAETAPVFAQLEANVLRWFAEIVGYPHLARGFLTSGTSLATLSAVITARVVQLGDEFSDAVIYVSDQAHHCVAKAARLAGIRADHIRILKTDDAYRLDPAITRDAIAADRASGLSPLMLVANAGTTNTGAVDPLHALADLADELGLWLHVDAAYGGFFCLTERGRAVLAGIERADSIALDPHKTLFLPYGTGALLVRDGAHLRAAHTSDADYLPDASMDDDIVDFADLSPELTRPPRGLRVWLPIKLHGAGVFRANLDEKLDLAALLHKRLQQTAGIEVLAAPELSILAFATRDEGDGVEARNRRTAELMQRIIDRGRVSLSATVLGDVLAIRVAIVSYRTHRDRIEALVDDLNEALGSTLKS